MQFSDRISALQPSAIREILKAPKDPNLITFAAGNPSADAFPKDEMALIASEIFAQNYASALQYGISEGYEPLRVRLFERVKTKYDMGGPDDSLIITSGGQQVIELCAKVLLNEGDAVVCENPSFIGALNALRSYNAKLIGVPTAENGMDLDELEKVLSENKNIKLIYTIPDFQNPTGSVMPLDSRKRLLNLAEKYNVFVLEDSPYYELRYDGEDLPRLKSLDKNGRVIFAGSFSKTIAPGIRIGYALGNKEIIQKIVVAKQVSDVHTNLFFQILVDKYLGQYDFDAHINSCREIYRKRRDSMVLALKNLNFNDFRVPQGGLFLWLNIPYDGNLFAQRAKENGVMVVPGSAFLVNDSDKIGAIRLNFSLPTEEQIEIGVKRLGFGDR